MHIEEVLNRVRRRFLDNDASLLIGRAHERTITHRIAFYLQDELKEWKVDCEYNRQGIGQDPKRDSAQRRRYPDVIVHMRTPNNDENLLVLEAKSAWSSKQSQNDDRDKLRRMVEKYEYKYAYLLIYSSGHTPDLNFECVHGS